MLDTFHFPSFSTLRSLLTLLYVSSNRNGETLYPSILFTRYCHQSVESRPKEISPSTIAAASKQEDTLLTNIPLLQPQPNRSSSRLAFLIDEFQQSLPIPTASPWMYSEIRREHCLSKEAVALEA